MKSIAMVDTNNKFGTAETRSNDHRHQQQIMNWLFISDGEYLKKENNRVEIFGTPVKPGSNTHRFRAMVHLRKKYFS